MDTYERHARPVAKAPARALRTPHPSSFLSVLNNIFFSQKKHTTTPTAPPHPPEASRNPSPNSTLALPISPTSPCTCPYTWINQDHTWFISDHRSNATISSSHPFPPSLIPTMSPIFVRQTCQNGFSRFCQKWRSPKHQCTIKPIDCSTVPTLNIIQSKRSPSTLIHGGRILRIQHNSQKVSKLCPTTLVLNLRFLHS